MTIFGFASTLPSYQNCLSTARATDGFFFQTASDLQKYKSQIEDLINKGNEKPEIAGHEALAEDYDEWAMPETSVLESYLQYAGYWDDDNKRIDGFYDKAYQALKTALTSTNLKDLRAALQESQSHFQSAQTNFLDFDSKVSRQYNIYENKIARKAEALLKELLSGIGKLLGEIDGKAS